jgi:Kef-type K+ transport system membrane component KefB
MEIAQDILGFLAILAAAYVLGRILTKIKLPAILGWLIAGIVLGPYLGGLVTTDFINNEYYKIFIHVFEAFAGVMIGAELNFQKLKKSGTQIIVTTLFQSLGTFLVVSAAFAVALYLTGKPIYLAFIFGGIALATAPAPALSIVNQYKTDGPVTRTLIPMAALDDIVGVVVFFTVISVTAGYLGADSMEWWKILLMVVLPIALGMAVGFLYSLIAKHVRNKWGGLSLLIGFLLVSVALGVVCDYYVFGANAMNYLIMSMAFSAVAANMVPQDIFDRLMEDYNPVISLSFLIVIVNLGMPLDYHYIAEAGVFTAVYILARAVGKYFGAYLGARVTKCDKNVRRYLGLTLLPHSGVSLVFTGIAVSTVQAADPEAAEIIQGTIVAAAIINEIIAVILAKVGFKAAGELGKAEAHTAEPAKTEETHSEEQAEGSGSQSGSAAS